MKTAGSQLYNSFSDIMSIITQYLKNDNAIDFMKISTHDSTKGYLFSATFEKPDVVISKRIFTKYYYVKWETSRAYITISKEHQSLANASNGGKTLNVKLLNYLEMYPDVTLIFADPYGIRLIDREFFQYNSYEFKQEYNGELVRGIDINKLIPINKFFK